MTSPFSRSTTSGWNVGGIQSRTDPKVYVVQTANEAVKRCILMTTDPGDLVLGPDLRFGNHGLRCRAVGQALDHHRYLPRRIGAGAGAHHGRAVSLVSARR